MSQRYGVSDEEREIDEGIRANWQPMVEAAGLYHPSQDTWTVYMLGGIIMRDYVVVARGGLKNMTPLEKQALRERIMQATAKARADRAAKAK